METINTYLDKHEKEIKSVGLLSDGYTLVEAEDIKSVLKVTKFTDEKRRYYIKHSANGLYNPFGSYVFSVGLDSNRNGQKVWQYREVNKKVFDLYFRFLGTKNNMYLTQAERELCNE